MDLNGKVYYALLSGSYQSLALEELRSILDVESSYYSLDLVLDGIALFRSDIRDVKIIVDRAGFIKEVGLALAISDSYLNGDWARDVSSSLGDLEVKIDVTRFKGFGGFSELDIIKALCPRLKCRLKSSNILRVLASEGLIIAGLMIDKAKFKSLESRRPRRRPFFAPGSLDPQISRLFVNLSRLKRGGVFLDPFCGTGGFALEACSMGASRVICGDIDWAMSLGALQNLRYYECDGRVLTLISDATRIPLSEYSVDAIATDPPYGRSSSTKKRLYAELTLEFLSEAKRVAKKNSYIVYAGPYNEQPWVLARDASLNITGRFHMFVHGNLVREIVVAKV
ncbi:MAG: RsmD family RNA methyltransferase [Acidilobaceae archaeon]